MDIKQQVYNVVSYGQLEDLIEEVYGKKLSVVAAMEWNNDSIYELFSGKSEDPGPENMAQLEEWVKTGKDGGYWGIVDHIMYDLWLKGKIPDGHYLVKVCW